MYIPERQLAKNKFLLGEIRKKFTFHAEFMMKEGGILIRDVQKEADYTKYGMKLQIAGSHNNKGAFQEALNSTGEFYEKLRDKQESVHTKQNQRSDAEACQGLKQS
jgi:hypothetical protein